MDKDKGGLSGGTDKEGLSGDREETDVDLLGVGSMEANMYVEFLPTNDMNNQYHVRYFFNCLENVLNYYNPSQCIRSCNLYFFPIFTNCM